MSSAEDLGTRLKKYEELYMERLRVDFVPVTVEKLKGTHDYFKEHYGSSALSSVWIDAATVMHLAYFILTNQKVDKMADGVRIYTEKFREKTEFAGKVFEKDTDNLAFMITYSKVEEGVLKHSDWVTVGSAKAEGDEYALDNYNDPDPPKPGGSLA